LSANEFTALSKDGSVFPVMIWASPIVKDDKAVGVRGILVNITEHKQAENELKKAEEKYRLVVENANEMILIAQDGRLKFVNRKSEEVTGYSREELMSKPFFHFIYPDDRQMVLENYSRRLKGSVKWLQINAVKTMWENRPATLNFLTDITEQKKAEDSLRINQVQFFQAQKMEAIGRLTGGVAHDLNNILTVIIGYSEYLMSEPTNHERYLHYLNEIKSAGEKASSFIKRLLAFSRRQILQPRVANLNKIILEMKKMLAHLIGEDIELHLELESNLDNVEIDINQFEQVIMNLSVNARDAMPEGGRIIVKTRNCFLNEEHTLNGFPARRGHYVMFEMSDNGIGMSTKVKEHLFEPFFTTKEEGKGTGLGLSTVYGIVKQSNGYISVNSAQGAGTTFEIYFPRVLLPDQTEKEIRSSKYPAADGSETILLVEDDDNLRSMISYILRAFHYTVLEAKNGDQALSCIHKNDRHPIDLMITDVIMPGMNGRVLADRIRSLMPDLKVLYMSGYTDDAIVQHGILEEGIPFIQKPFSVNDFGVKIREVLTSSRR
jgi:two-component system cell cycle sensor histidine kinase/response regulator CckA